MLNAIATSSPLADIAAGIGIVAIAIVTFLNPRSEDAVAALGEATGIGAAVVIDTVTIIAVFVGWILRLEVLPDDAITTPGSRTAG